MRWHFNYSTKTSYWLKVFALYALAEACVQLIFFIILNNFGTRRISIIEFHLVMWIFQCILIWPIWWVASKAVNQSITVQIFVNLVFYAFYSWCWFGPVQQLIGFFYNHLQEITRAVSERQVAVLDSGKESSYLNYQLLKHTFRLSWFYLAAYFYNYLQEEKQRNALALSNKELSLKMLNWHLNPSFYFKTIEHLQTVADKMPQNATGPILQLAKVMEYVIYETRERLIDVKKEIQFLHNYTQLLNQQENKLKLVLAVSGEYESLKIQPLLLAGFIDKILSESGCMHTTYQTINLKFSPRQMEFYITEQSERHVLLPFLRDKEISQKLAELYAGRYIKEDFKFILKLEDER